MYKQKQEKKDEEKRQKEERKLQRIQKKELKVCNKTQMKNLSTKKEKINNKKINVLSNVVLKQNNKIPLAHVRTLFTSPSSDDVVEIDTETFNEHKSNDEINNIEAYEEALGNLCYECTFKITKKRQGLKCKLCVRTYHLNCIEKKCLGIDSTVFICKNCR